LPREGRVNVPQKKIVLPLPGGHPEEIGKGKRKGDPNLFEKKGPKNQKKKKRRRLGVQRVLTKNQTRKWGGRPMWEGKRGLGWEGDLGPWGGAAFPLFDDGGDTSAKGTTMWERGEDSRKEGSSVVGRIVN